MSKGEVMYEPHPRYVIQVGYPVHEALSFNREAEDDPRDIEWESREYYSDLDEAKKYADKFALEEEYVRVLDRGKK